MPQDDSDFQYKTFREHFPLLAVLLAVYCSLSWLSSRFGGGKAAQVPSLRSSGHSQSTAAPQRRFFLAGFTAVFVAALHGTNALKLGLVLLINYTIARSFGGTRVAPVLIWTFNIGTLAAVHWNDGFPWRDLSWQLGWLVSATLLLLLLPCAPADAGRCRTTTRACCLAGRSTSTSRCCASSRTRSTCIGHGRRRPSSTR
jgi:hypothetical protein